MKWPKNIKNIGYGVIFNEEIMVKIVENGFLVLKNELERIQGTVEVEYSGTSKILITVVCDYDHQDYWKMVEKTIMNHIKH